jgi:hypothetical protein
MLPLYKGRAWRAETNLLIHGNTALDVIEFEENELGNKSDFKHLTNKVRKELNNISVNRVIWVCKTKKEAKRYGEAKRENLGKNPKIIAEDGDNGYLILKEV